MEVQKMNQEVSYTAGGQEITLTPSLVAQFVTKGNGKISMVEAVNFMNLCKYSGLNPFLNEAYLIKYGSRPAQMVVSKEAVLKRASRESTYKGMTSGIITVDQDNKVHHRKGQLVYPGEKLFGAWAEVYRSDYENPIYAEVALSEYNTGKSTWGKMPSNMINKVAQNKALREAYPDQLGAMYTEEEPTPDELQSAEVVDPEQEKKAQNILEDFKEKDDQNSPIKTAIEIDEKEQEEVDALLAEVESEGDADDSE